MTTTFTWKPDAKPSGTKTFRVLAAQFGDGYKQTVADGINNASQAWPLTFTGQSSAITPIRDFLDARAGWQAFYWTPPLGTRGFYKCETYELKQVGFDVWQIAATFNETFQP